MDPWRRGGMEMDRIVRKKRPRVKAAAGPPDTEAAMGGKWRQRLLPAFGGGAERQERGGPLHTPKWRCLTGENWIHPSSELEFGGRETSQRARESRNPRERRMRLTGTEEKRERERAASVPLFGGSAGSSRWREENRPRQLWRGRVSTRQIGCLVAVYVVGP